MNNFVAVILAGGSGERFWPLSRKHKPKQFLTLEGQGYSLLQATAQRLLELTGGFERIFVVTSSEYRGQVFNQLPDLPSENLIVEPVARDTAPAILYAALCVQKRFPDAVMGVFASDHRITDPEAFVQVIARAGEVARTQNMLVTLGVTPTFASTGYGYIQQCEVLEDGPVRASPMAAYRVKRFAEKPDAITAQAFIDSGLYTWNSGIFVWQVQTVLEEFKTHQPQLSAQLEGAILSRDLLREVFPTLEKVSVDYALMEKSSRVAVIPAEFGWDDLGDWNALERMLRGDNPNVSIGKHVGLDTEGAILYTTRGDDLIVTIGLEDVVIVRDDDVTLVVRKDRTQDIKKIVQKLKSTPELERFV